MGLTRPTAAQINSNVEVITDPLSVLNNRGINNNQDVGFIMNRNGGGVSNVAVFWQESNQQFVFAYTTSNGSINSNVTVTSNADVQARNFIGNGSQLTGLPQSYSNVQVATYLPTYAGNVSAAYFTGSGQFLTGLPAGYSNVNVAAYTQTQSYTNYSNVNLAAYLGGTVTVGGNLTVQGNLIVLGNLSTFNIETINTTEYISSTGNLVISNANPSISSTTGVIVTLGGVGFGGNLNAGTVGAVSGAFHTVVGNLTQSSSGGSVYFNTTGNISTAQLNAGQINTTGNILSTGAILNNVIVNTGNINAVGGYFVGNGFFLTGIVGGGGGGGGTTNKMLYSGLATVSNTATLIDTVPVAGNTAVNWQLTSIDNVNNGYKSSMINSINDGINVYYNEYGALTSNANSYVTTFTSNILNGTINLYAIGISNNVTVAFERTLLGNTISVGYLTSGTQGNVGNTGPSNYSNINVAAYLGTTTSNISIGGNLTIGTVGVVSGAFHTVVGNITQTSSGGAVYINTTGNVLATGGIFNALTVNGLINASGNVLATGASIFGNVSLGSLAVPGALNTLVGNVSILGVSSMLNIIGNIVVNNTAIASSNVTGAIRTTGGIGVGGNLYVGQRVGYVWGANNVSSVYQIFNNSTNSLDTVFG